MEKKGIVVSNHKYSLKESIYFPELWKGIKISLKHFFANIIKSKYIVTQQYPEVKIAYPERFRGKHRLMTRDDGTLRCVACMMCATACPAECIYIEAEDVGDIQIEKRAKVFVIDELRCVFCGLCVEACPTDAIRMDTGEHVPPEYSREAFIYDKNTLLKNAGKSIAVQGGDSNYKNKI